MKVLLVGHFENIWSTNIEMSDAFLKLGYKVKKFDYRKNAKLHIKKYEKNYFFYILNKFLSFCRRFSFLNNFFGKYYYKILGRGEMLKKLNKLINKKFDLVMFLKTDTVDPSIIRDFSKYNKTWYYFMDPPYVANKINVAAYVRNSTYASATFPELYRNFKKINKKSFHIRQGYNVNIFKKINKNKTIDFLFVGTKDKKRLKLVKYLNKFFKISCYGHGWKNKPVYSKNLNILFNSTKVILNFNRPGDGFSVRLFQILGSGSFVISEYSKDFKKVFKNKKNLVWYKNLTELKKLCKYYLENKYERDLISQKSINIVRKKFSWQKIILQIKKKSNV